MHKLILVGVAAALALPAVAFATQPQVDESPKSFICHRTNSVTNPYNKIEVSYSAIDGEGENDHMHHTGPIATSEAVAQALKDAKIKHGDIIPMIPTITPGLNWTAEGQAMFNNDCNFVPPEVEETEVPVEDRLPTTTAPHDPQSDSTTFSKPKGK